jgi:hypothetical protein
MKGLQPQLSPEDKGLMEKLLLAGHIEHKYAVRLQTVLLRAKGKGTSEISEFLGIHQSTVGLFINRYNTFGIESLLKDKSRKPGDKRPDMPPCMQRKTKKPDPLELPDVGKKGWNWAYLGKPDITRTRA